MIVIELKKNPSGDLRVTYNGSMEIEAPDLSSYDLCNAAEKLEVEQAFGMFNDPGADFESQRMMIKMYNQRQSAVKSGINTDWISKPLRLGVGNKHSLSVELGDKALQAIVDLSYQNIKGVMKGSDRTNISGAISLLYRHQNFLFRNQLTITSNEAHDSKYGTFDEYTKLNPYYTPYDQYGHLTDNIVPSLDPGNSVTVNAWYEDIEFEANPLYNAQLNTLLQDKYVDITNNFELQWFVMTGLKATARFGLTEQRSRSDEFYPSDHLKFASYSTDRLTEKGSYDLENGEQHSLSGKFDVQYNKNFLSVHDIFVNAGFDLSRKQSSTNLQQAEGFPSDKMTDIIFARQYLKDAKPKGTEETVKDFGYYLSANYSYDNRLNFDATFRQSASSMYGANSRWGKFWSVGGSWNIHNESWMEGSNITQLRLRATTGSTGSQSSAAYNTLASYEYFLDKTYGGQLGAQLLNMRNEDLQWQEKVEQNYGFDFNYKNRYSFTFEYYHSITNNAVNPLSLAPSTGFTTVQENVGKVLNRGFDLRAGATVWQQPADRSYLSFSLMISRNKNILKEISEAMRSYNEQQEKLATEGNVPVQKYYDGVSMDAIWAMPSLGIDPANGREIYIAKDENGNPYRTYTYDAAQQVICGDELPKFQGNAGVNFETEDAPILHMKAAGTDCFKYHSDRKRRGIGIPVGIDQRKASACAAAGNSHPVKFIPQFFGCCNHRGHGRFDLLRLAVHAGIRVFFRKQCVVDSCRHIAFAAQPFQHLGVTGFVSAGKSTGVKIDHKTVCILTFVSRYIKIKLVGGTLSIRQIGVCLADRFIPTGVVFAVGRVAVYFE